MFLLQLGFKAFSHLWVIKGNKKYIIQESGRKCEISFAIMPTVAQSVINTVATAHILIGTCDVASKPLFYHNCLLF